MIHQSPLSGQNKYGPPIKLIFFINDSLISRIEVVESNVFEWQIFSDSNFFAAELIEEWLEDYCNKKDSQVVLPLCLKGVTPYTEKIMTLLTQIPFGSALTYSELAKCTDMPRGARAVGNACGRNPFPVIVPCHRVLRKGGDLGGFSAGIEIKKRLLAFESISYQTK